MTYEKKDSQMRCPGCRRYSLKRKDERITCSTCGYTLTPGEEARFRLYELLKTVASQPFLVTSVYTTRMHAFIT